MYNHLIGILVEKQPPLLVIEVQGVGYEIEAPMSTFYQLPALQETLKLFTHLSIRDDAHILYGFHSTAERQLFRELIRISGVGAKMALAILSAMDQTRFAAAVEANDTAKLTRIPGVGKKTAERLVIEMRDRLANLSSHAPAAMNTDATTAPPESSTLVTVDNPREDAISALIALGYKPQEATRWVKSIKEENLSSEELIKRALRAAL